VLSEEAYERLKTIGEATDLGSGFKIAMRDLEIRGAGNLLGEAQSGHIAAVGYDLYCQLVTEAVSEMKGEAPVALAPELKLDISTNAYLPTDYVAKEEMRLDAYRRLAAVSSTVDVDDIRSEWLDRYGPLPAAAEALVEVGMLRAECHRVGLRELVITDGRARLAPIVLKASQRMRVTRLAKSHVYDEESHILTVTLPNSGRSTDDGGRNVRYLIEFLRDLVDEPN
jgi:transcription-repair coupling factor (superfamily II helicase)